MKPEQIKDNELDKMMHNALGSDEDMLINDDLSDKIIRKLEKRIVIRGLLLELFMKIGVVIVSLALLAGVFVWIKGSNVLTGLYDHFVDNWHIITSLLLLVFITLFIDQVGLKFYAIFGKKVKLGS